jgi:hypothetical protein
MIFSLRRRNIIILENLRNFLFDITKPLYSNMLFIIFVNRFSTRHFFPFIPTLGSWSADKPPFYSKVKLFNYLSYLPQFIVNLTELVPGKKLLICQDQKPKIALTVKSYEMKEQTEEGLSCYFSSGKGRLG